MQNYGVPISGKEPIRHELSGITYLLRHAIGTVESRILAIQGSIYSINSFVPQVAKQIDSEHNGNPWADGERMEAISKAARALADVQFWQNYSIENESRRRDEIFDVICLGWEGDCYKLSEGEKPSEHVRAAVKHAIVDWWMNTQLTLSGEDQKNSERRPDAVSQTLLASPSIADSVPGEIKSVAGA